MITFVAQFLKRIRGMFTTGYLMPILFSSPPQHIRFFATSTGNVYEEVRKMLHFLRHQPIIQTILSIGVIMFFFGGFIVIPILIANYIRSLSETPLASLLITLGLTTLFGIYLTLRITHKISQEYRSHRIETYAVSPEGSFGISLAIIQNTFYHSNSIFFILFGFIVFTNQISYSLIQIFFGFFYNLIIACQSIVLASLISLIIPAWLESDGKSEIQVYAVGTFCGVQLVSMFVWVGSYLIVNLAFQSLTLQILLPILVLVIVREIFISKLWLHIQKIFGV